MAKVTAPFQIVGTLDDINFYVNDANTNIARKKAESSMTNKKFKTLPSYHSVRMQNLELKHCSKISQIFRRITLAFNKNAKEGSYVGRANAIFLHMVKEDPKNERGYRLVTEGIKSKYGREYLRGFESNKLRPLHKVLVNKKWTLNDHHFHFPDCSMETDIDWPEEATHVTFNLAVANWNIETNQYATQYAEPQFFAKTSTPQDITIIGTPPTDQDLHLTFLFIGFSKQQGSRHVPLHRKHNTATLIDYHYFPKHANEDTPSPEETPSVNVPPPFLFS